MRTTRVLAAGLLAFLLVGCSAQSGPQAAVEVTNEQQSPSAELADEKSQTLGEVGSVAELRDAVVQAGYPCQDWTQTNVVANAAESGSCSERDVLSTYASQPDRDAQVAQERANKDLLRSAGLEPGVTIVGPNWMANLPADADIESIHAVLGGILIS